MIAVPVTATMRDVHGTGWRVRSLASIERRRARINKAGSGYFAAKPGAPFADPTARCARTNYDTLQSKPLADTGAQTLSPSSYASKQVDHDNGGFVADPMQMNDPWLHAARIAGPAVTAATHKSFVDASTQTSGSIILRLEEAIPLCPPACLTLPDPGGLPLGLDACLGSPTQAPDEDRRAYELDFAEVWDTVASHTSSLEQMDRRLEALKGYVSKAISGALTELTEGSYMKSVNDNTATLVTGVYNSLQSKMSKMQLAIDKLADELADVADKDAERELADVADKDAVDPSVFDSCDAQHEPFPEPSMKCSVLPIGDTALVHGLLNATHLNNLVGMIEGYHEVSDRYEVRFAPQLALSSIKACNLMHPARCPHCSSEITGSQCFACPSGHLVLHESLRICNPSQSDDGHSLSSDSHMDFSFADSLTPEGPGSHSGNGSQLHANIAQHEDT